MIDNIQQGIHTNITMNELYNIIDIYSKSFIDTYDGHNNCLCKKYFKFQNIEMNKNIEKMSKYLTKHYEDINIIGRQYNKFFQKYSNINWLRKHKIVYNGMNDDFELSKKINHIGYDDNNVFIIYIKPQFNDLNLYDTLIDSIYDTFLIKNVKNPSHINNTGKCLEDFKKFYNKNIVTVVFSLDNKNYKLFRWFDKESLELINNKLIMEMMRQKLIKKYTNEINYVYNYYKYYREHNINIIAKKFIKNFIIFYKNDKNFLYFNNDEEDDKRPQFLLRFFQKIEDDITSSKNKEETLKKTEAEFKKKPFIKMNYILKKLKEKEVAPALE
jgi:hypothetical protein